ncbi:hypothetical protein EDB89DRAFT_1907062 [Lactarius sanguifluus]|nr:hypothetical protein EDB89DRAFT_1907062 [Lactarius sanguifluus]
MSGMPRPEALHQIQGQDRQVTKAKALVKPLIPIAKVLEEGRHGLLLVSRVEKVVREAATGETRCDLRLVARRSVDGGDPGTYQYGCVLRVGEVQYRTSPARHLARAHAARRKHTNWYDGECWLGSHTSLPASMCRRRVSWRWTREGTRGCSSQELMSSSVSGFGATRFLRRPAPYSHWSSGTCQLWCQKASGQGPLQFFRTAFQEYFVRMSSQRGERASQGCQEEQWKGQSTEIQW